jgi:hypothetical protein
MDPSIHPGCAIQCLHGIISNSQVHSSLRLLDREDLLSMLAWAWSTPQGETHTKNSRNASDRPIQGAFT